MQGLLNKKPSDRLGWPELLEHPFVRETAEERTSREKALVDAMEIADSSRAWRVSPMVHLALISPCRILAPSIQQATNHSCVCPSKPTSQVGNMHSFLFGTALN